MMLFLSALLWLVAVTINTILCAYFNTGPLITFVSGFAIGGVFSIPFFTMLNEDYF